MLGGLVVTVSLVACALFAGCGDSGTDDPQPTPSAPAGNPFSATLEGPDVAEAGDVITVTVTNTGRLPDRYQLKSDPTGVATSDPFEISLGPGESGDLQVTVGATPVVLSIESIGGGSGIALDELSIGAQV